MPPIQFRLFSENLIKEVTAVDKESRTSQKSDSDTVFERKTDISEDQHKSGSSEGEGGMKFEDQNDTDEEDENTDKEGGKT